MIIDAASVRKLPSITSRQMISPIVSNDKKLTVLVTGANGGLARSVCNRLPKNIVAVGLVRQGTARQPSQQLQVFDRIDALLADIPHIDAVLHLAARIPSPHERATDLLAVNVDLVSTLIQTLPSARHVLASSASVYGSPDNSPLHINSLPNPVSAYGWSKLAAECLVRQCKNHAVIRYASLIGRNGRPNTFVPSIVAAARDGCITLYGDGRRQQNYVDLDDAADMCLRALVSKTNFTTLGVSDRSYSNNEVAEILSGLTGAVIRHVGIDESPSYTYDCTGAIALGPCLIPLKTTLEDLLSS